ncbi:MAG: NAD(P)H-dependent glycerol-3-phosphate dehydrogenase [Peptostreptococcaceae bacterium]|nr:NAD(P)H-dependent glycerol-3-phosphate dehydrogenase [Peptostreptococcaceae bacterium]
MKKICVLGAGSWGTALAKVIADNGHRPGLWMRDERQANEIKKTRYNEKYLKNIKLPETLRIENDIGQAVSGAEAVVLAVSSQSTRQVLMALRGKIDEKVLLINVSKGLERETNKRISEICAEIFPNNPFAVLSGPSHAEEVAVAMPTTLVSASAEIAVAQKVQDLFSNHYFRVYTNPDVLGVELAGALKNIIAFGVGVIDGLGYGDNTKAAIMTRGLVEMTRLGTRMGAQVQTFAGLAGVGDLIVTCTSMHSRNRRAGMLVGQGKSMEEALGEVQMVVEGVTATKAAHDLAEKLGVVMPITTEIYEVLYRGKDVTASIKSLMSRDKKHETEELWSFPQQ